MQFTFLNIPVTIHPSFWIFFLFFTDLIRDPSVESCIFGIVLIVSLLVHEYGHALTAQYFGAKPSINLEAFGGNAQYDGRGITPRQSFLITLNGPLLESVLVLLSYILLEADVFYNQPYIQYFLHVTMYVNVLWILLNLLPVVPLDGGQLMSNILQRIFGNKGLRASAIIGVVAAAVTAPYLYLEGYYIFGTLLLFFAYQNFQMLQVLKASSGEAYHFSRYSNALEAIKDNDLKGAKAILTDLIKSKDPLIKHLSIESLAEIHCQENEGQKAYDLLIRADYQFLNKGKCLLCRLAFERDNFELVKALSREIYEVEPSYEIALLNSKAFAYLNQPSLAGAWLETASQFEIECKEAFREILLHSSYDAVRDHNLFKAYAEKVHTCGTVIP